MKFNIITIFPEILESYFSKGMMRIAQEKKLIKVKYIDLRKFAVDNRGTIDDRPYGGGVGQVFMIEPIYKVIRKIKERKTIKTSKSKIVLLSAKGKKWNQEMAKKFSKLDEVTFICPRYEGVDERVRKFVDEDISLGDYVLTGGELGAAVIIDSVSRLIPGVLGKEDSFKEESHSVEGFLEYPHYTRPEVFKYREVKKTRSQEVKYKELKVPKVLLSGHHKKIEEWRKNNSQKVS